MPDISMCQNDACRLAGKCYRHEAETKHPRSQAYSAFLKDTDSRRCEAFMPLWDMEDKTKMQNELSWVIDGIAEAMASYRCTITTAPRGEPYATGEVNFIITHTPSGESVRLRELTADSLLEALRA